MVPGAGVEPALPCGNKILSLACLPVPPRPPTVNADGRICKNLIQITEVFYVEFGATLCTLGMERKAKIAVW